jgi:hypothetical protein
LKKTPILLETMLRDLPEDLLLEALRRTLVNCGSARPSPDLEMVYADALRRMVTEDTPTLQKYDPTGTVVIGD